MSPATRAKCTEMNASGSISVLPLSSVIQFSRPASPNLVMRRLL